VFYNYIIY